MAEILGEDAQRATHDAVRDAFQRHAVCLVENRSSRSVAWTFVPGSVEFADFDPSATSIAISVADELHRLPRPAIDQTFEKYLEGFASALAAKSPGPIIVPTRFRIIGALVRLGRRQRRA